MLSRARARAAAVAIVATVGHTASGQEPPQTEVPTFAAQLDVILVGAVVTDRQGRPVKGLKAEDFALREDGAPQALTSFEAVDLPLQAPGGPWPPAAAEAPRTSRNADAGAGSQHPRVFLLAMDDAGLGLDGAATAKRVAKQFLSSAVRPGDRVSLVAPGVGINWSVGHPEGTGRLAAILDSVQGLRALAPEVSGDWDAMRAAEALDSLAVERVRLGLDAAGLLPTETRLPGDSQTSYAARNRALQNPYARMNARRQLDQDRERRQELYAAVERALSAVAAVKGRKTVLLLSEGFIREPDDPAFRALLTAARQSDASIYFVNVLRLSSGMTAETRQPRDRSSRSRGVDANETGGAEQIAEQTGGFSLQNPNDLEAGLARIARESASYYLLGYSPLNTKRDGTYRRIEVELRRAELKVRARKGYFAPGPDAAPPRTASAKDADPQLEQALASAVPASAIPLRLTALSLRPLGKEKVRVKLVGEVNLEPVRFEPAADGSRLATLDVALALQHVQAAGRQRTPWREWKLSVPAQAAGQSVWVPVDAVFDVPAGACQGRLVVRDRNGGALGSVLHDFEVPDPSAFRVSTPILSDMPGEGLSDPPRAQLDRSFVAGAPLYCYLEVYRGKGGRKGTGPARVSLAYSLVDGHGRSLKAQTAMPLRTGPDGIWLGLQTIPLAGVKPGEYELRLSVRDESTGRAQELREPFVLKRPSHPDPAIYLELVQAFRAGDLARASSGVMEWRPEDLAKLAASLPTDDTALRRAALQLHTEIAFRLWSHGRAAEAEAQIAIGRAVLAKGATPGLQRDWLLTLGYYRLDAGSPLSALPYFEDCARRFPELAEAWLGAGMCYELTAFPAGFALTGLTAQDAARQAERSYREAVRLDPGLADARLRLGRVLASTKAFDEAERELAAAVDASASGPLKALAQLFWGSVRDARGDLAGAVAHYQAALLADRECQTAALALSEALFRSGRHRAATKTLTSALSEAGASDVSPWHAYHLGADHWKALRVAPQAPPVATAAPLQAP